MRYITLSVKEYAEVKDIKLEFTTDMQHMIVCCDPNKIERVMLNLLSNAVKFTNKGGNIGVKVAKKEEHILISVKDSGIGIPEDKKGIIFERFRQTEESLTRNYEGSGIGLSLSKSFIKMHDGDIYFESTERVGSEFFVELPLKEIANNCCNETIYQQKLIAHSDMEKVTIELSDIR